jgi:DICT domain-containing protein
VELQPARRPRDDAREFEVIWSVEPQVVRAASEICLGLARRADPRLADRLEARTAPAPPPPAEQLRLAAAITTRTLGALS